MRIPRLALGCLLALTLQVPEEISVRGVSLPAGRLAERLMAGAEAAPLPAGEPWPEWSDRSPQGFGGERAWRRWVELVRAERESSSPRRRAELAVLARLQGRDVDAWTHLAACAPEPGLIATLLPLFCPGVPQALLGKAGPLPDGVVLRPALPPCDDARGSLRFLAGRRVACPEFALGSARVALEVSVDRDGLEVELQHLGGGAARVAILPPLPRGVDAGLVFADWEKRPGHVGPLEFALDGSSPDGGASEHSLWLTFHPPQDRWPQPLPDELAPLVPGRALVLVAPPGEAPHLARFADALAEILEVPTRLASTDTPLPGELEPLVLRFDVQASAERKLVELIGMAEAFALRAAVR